MPSRLHEALLLLFRNRPTLVTEVLRGLLDETVPSFTDAQIVSAELTEAIPVEHRADLVVLLAAGDFKRAIVIEVQLRRDPRKRYTWPLYVAGVHARYECPTCLLVLTIHEDLMKWCAKPIEMGHPGFVMTPLVLGPGNIPLMIDIERARAAPELVVLSAMAHGQGVAGEAIGRTFLQVADGLEQEHARIYFDLVMSFIHEAARKRLEGMMKGGYVPRSDIVRSWVEEGREKGSLQAKAQAVMAIFEARSLVVPAELRERIFASTNLNELEQWIRRAVLIDDPSELLSGAPACA
ncbi:hypothetical protein [Chondromyces crocatus]|uniref:Transposase (putative) YhgA-like domain-containing protein n=1 Tax=Chondromyces crocatus TaxID=52 RepID=A0A0K1E9V9_CHOCO|nr:hypothetical protein [Chondromyces crocatus]AKT37650.1 uncharacterized protein CMC5_017920 [Chondromyces crocatus]